MSSLETSSKQRFEASKYGLICSKCGESENGLVLETRTWEGEIIRVRSCKRCNHRFYTIENQGESAWKKYQEYNTLMNQAKSRKKSFDSQETQKLGVKHDKY